MVRSLKNQLRNISTQVFLFLSFNFGQEYWFTVLQIVGTKYMDDLVLNKMTQYWQELRKDCSMASI